MNIANFTLGRADKGGQAIALLYIDDQPSQDVLGKLAATGRFASVAPLRFSL